MDQPSELLGSLKARLVLEGYAEPASPSEVARVLEMPANSVHYWTKRLLEDGLLEQVSRKGRVRTYRSRLVDGEEACEPESCIPFVRNVLGVLNKVVLAAAERHELGDAGAGIRRPEIGVHEVKLRPADVGRIVEALKSTIPNSEDQTHEDGDTYTVSFIVAPGRVSDHL